MQSFLIISNQKIYSDTPKIIWQDLIYNRKHALLMVVCSLKDVHLGREVLISSIMLHYGSRNPVFSELDTVWTKDQDIRSVSSLILTVLFQISLSYIGLSALWKSIKQN